MEGFLESLNRLAAHAAEVKFAVLGSVYLWPGKFLKLSALGYGLVMLGGLAWIGGTAAAALRMLKPLGRRAASLNDSRIAGRILAAFSLFYVLSGLYVTFAYPPTTDEPHYLLIAESVLKDGDIELSNNYSNRDYASFYPSSQIDAHAVVSRDGKMYSQHTAGLPLLILPFYAFAGRWGVSIVLSLAAAALVALLFLVCRAAGIRADSAAQAAVLAGITVPLLPASNLVFTEVPAALLAAAALLKVREPWVPAAAGAALPWLHPRYALLSAGLALLNLIRGRRKTKIAAAWAALTALSAGVFLLVYRGDALVSVLNVITERYPARIEELSAGFLAGQSIGNPVTGLLGKLFDRDFGVIPFSPWLLALLAGAALREKGVRDLHFTFLAGAGAYLLASSAFRNWGGSAFPGRTLVPLAPFLVPYAAFGIEWARRRAWSRRIFYALAGIAALISIALTVCPVLRYTSGRDWMAENLGGLWLAAPFNWFPSFAVSPLWASAAGIIISAVVVLAARIRGRGGR